MPEVIKIEEAEVKELLGMYKQVFPSIPENAAFEGMDRRLTVEERSFLALFSASATFLSKKGVRVPKVQIVLHQFDMEVSNAPVNAS